MLKIIRFCFSCALSVEVSELAELPKRTGKTDFLRNFLKNHFCLGMNTILPKY